MTVCKVCGAATDSPNSAYCGDDHRLEARRARKRAARAAKRAARADARIVEPKRRALVVVRRPPGFVRDYTPEELRALAEFPAERITRVPIGTSGINPFTGKAVEWTKAARTGGRMGDVHGRRASGARRASLTLPPI